MRQPHAGSFRPATFDYRMHDSSDQSERAPKLGPAAAGRRDLIVTRLLQARLLLSSYAALNLILFARINPQAPKLACLGLALIGIADGYRMTRMAKDRDLQPVIFKNVRDSGAEVAAYVATYVLPLIAAPNPDGWDLFAYGVYGVVIILISVNSKLLQVNPTLYGFGRRLVTVTRQDGTEQLLICRRVPPSNVRVYVTRHLGALYEVDVYGEKSK